MRNTSAVFIENLIKSYTGESFMQLVVEEAALESFHTCRGKSSEEEIGMNRIGMLLN